MVRTKSTFRPLLLGCALVAVPLLCGAKGTGCGSSPTIPIGNDGGGGGSSSSSSSSTSAGGACTVDQCGPVLGLLNYQCPDGKTTAGPTGKCISTANGCGWEVIQCPDTDQCTPDECGPQLGTLNWICDDGSVGGPTGNCLKNANGGCSWELRQCPPKGGFKWFTTCGDPVCHTPDPDNPDVPNCTAEMAGDACSTPGAVCEVPGDSCGVNLVCASEDPKSGSCPKSLASEKYGIEYVTKADLARIHDDLLETKIARWHYHAESSDTREHLGFIIDDQPNSAAVAANGQRVDLYGYTSMAVAAVQVQAKQIEALEREVRALERKVEVCRGAK